MKRNHNQAGTKPSRRAAAPQSKTVLLRLWRRSAPGGGIRLQFVEDKTRRVLFSSVFERGLLTIIERTAKKDGISVGQFIINALNWFLDRRALKASQGQGRAAA